MEDFQHFREFNSVDVDNEPSKRFIVYMMVLLLLAVFAVLHKYR